MNKIKWNKINITNIAKNKTTCMPLSSSIVDTIKTKHEESGKDNYIEHALPEHLII